MPETSTTLFFAGLAVTIFVARYFVSSSSAPGGGRTARSGGAPQREVTEDMVSVVSVLVPQIDRETIRRDLQETRSIERTSERLLAKAKKEKAGNGSLLEKYNIDEDNSAISSENAESAGWIDDRKKREEHFKLQRQRMVLKARQRTLELEKEKEKKATA